MTHPPTKPRSTHNPSTGIDWALLALSFRRFARKCAIYTSRCWRPIAGSWFQANLKNMFFSILRGTICDLVQPYLHHEPGHYLQGFFQPLKKKMGGIAPHLVAKFKSAVFSTSLSCAICSFKRSSCGRHHL